MAKIRYTKKGKVRPQKKKKKTPGNGFVIWNCKEKMKPLEMMFDAIDQGKVLING